MSTESVKRRLTSATPGPWVSNVEDRDPLVGTLPDVARYALVRIPGEPYNPRWIADQDFIAHARTDLELAVDVIQAAQEWREHDQETFVGWLDPADADGMVCDVCHEFSYSCRAKIALFSALEAWEAAT